MPKLLGDVTFFPSNRTGFMELRSPYNTEVLDLIHKYPKSYWDKKRRAWTIPAELATWLRAYMVEHIGWNVPTVDHGYETHEWEPRLYEYQNEAISMAVNRGFFFNNFEMGLGKTPTTIHTLAAEKPRRTLIVCPAVVRKVWEKELDKWWPEHPPVYLCTTGKKAEAASTEGIVVVSYHLVARLPFVRWDAIILDESHMAKNNQSGMGAACIELGKRHNNAFKVALTGTPVAQEPKDLWAQMEFLRPGGFGAYWDFVQRYVGKIPNSYARSGFTYTGADNEEELVARLDYFAMRRTRSDVAHLLPKVTIQTIGVQDKPQSLLELLDGCTINSVVFVFQRKTANTLTKLLTKTRRHVALITGEDSPERRHKLIDDALVVPGSVLVATMDSLGTGVDLTAFPLAFFLELSPKLSTIRQALGRVVRLSSNTPVSVTFLYQEGTRDEQMMVMLESRLNEVNKVSEPGQAEQTLSTFLAGEQLNDKEWAEKLNDELAGWEEEDEYF